MAITLTEQHDSRETWGSSDGTKRMRRIYLVEGTGDPYVAEGQGPAYGQGFGGDLFVSDKHAWRLPAADQESCMLEVTYTTKQPGGGVGPALAPIEELEISGTTVHIERAITQTHYPFNEDTGDIIGSDIDNIRGTEKFVPQGTYRYTDFYLSFPRATWQDRFQHVGKINRFRWKGFEAGEVLFAGMNIRKNAHNYYEVLYRFLWSPNASFQIRSAKYGLIDIIKSGHDYFWVSKEIRVSNVGGINKKQYNILAGHVARIYDFVNFGVIGIGS